VSDPITTVRVALDLRSYDIVIGSGLIDRLAEHVGAIRDSQHAVVITDSNVAERHGIRAAAALAGGGRRVDTVIVQAGETSKSVGESERLWQHLLHHAAHRKTLVVAVGGGVIGDLAGFAAATYARGLRFIQVPTTLLAHVDSSVGGKVGINLPGAKNMVGAFWQPELVVIDLDTLRTLPEREYHAGLAEVVKYGVILDAEFFAYLEEHVEAILARETEPLRHIVGRCCRLKADVVEADERELTGLRAVLNYGHTFGHAIEAVTGYGRFLHGEAVAIGMHQAAQLAQRSGRIDAQFVARQARLLEAFQLPLSAGHLDPSPLLAAMQHDKKAADGRLRFVLPTRLGHVELVDNVSTALVRELLADQR
jgi:3-dehydroquinate synthase